MGLNMSVIPFFVIFINAAEISVERFRKGALRHGQRENFKKYRRMLSRNVAVLVHGAEKPVLVFYPVAEVIEKSCE